MLCKKNRLKIEQRKRRLPALRGHERAASDSKRRESTIEKRISLRKMRNWSATIICVLVCALVLNLGVSAAHRAILQRGIAEEVLRFHVLANSDDEADQNVKLMVRDAVLEWIDTEWNDKKVAPDVPENSAEQTRELGERAVCETNNTGEETAKPREGQTERKDTDSGKESELSFLSEHLSEIEGSANRVLEEQGMSYQARASIENCYFPERTYGDCTFPAGWYDALRIRLGEAKGHNWWCVLYPGLCFSDCLHAVVEDGGLADLKELLTVEEYESLFRHPKKWKIAFRWF